MPLSADQKRELEAAMREFVGKPIGPAFVGRDPVNQPMIRQWCDAMGDRDPAYESVAPPTMLQAWTMQGFEMAKGYDEPRNNEHRIHKLLTEHGYTSVVATNTEQSYSRYLRPGDVVTAETTIESVSEEKATALGIGYFIDTRTTFRDQHGAEVGWMTFRVLKFAPQQRAAAAEAPAAAAAQPKRIRPPLGHDNGWWWQLVDQGVIPIQKCNGCGKLHHPPRPMCDACRSTDLGHVAASGRGTLHTFTVIHYPQFPGY